MKKMEDSKVIGFSIVIIVAITLVVVLVSTIIPGDGLTGFATKNVQQNFTSCWDSDAVNISTYGVVIGQRNNGTWQAFPDYCETSYHVVENYCLGISPTSLGFNCTTGSTCSDGRCVAPVVVNNCIDSDGGKNYYLKGNVTNSSSIVYDFCFNSNSLGEYYCNGSIASLQSYNCSAALFSCSNGACTNSTY